VTARCTDLSYLQLQFQAYNRVHKLICSLPDHRAAKKRSLPAKRPRDEDSEMSERSNDENDAGAANLADRWVGLHQWLGMEAEASGGWCQLLFSVHQSHTAFLSEMGKGVGG